MEIKIYPRLIGRLGNNLFQIAAAIGYAKKHNVGWGIRKGYVERSFNAHQVDRFIPNLPSINTHFKNYTEFQDHWAGSEFNFHEIPFRQSGVEIVGFWQSWKYFDNAQDEVRKAFNINYQDGYSSYCSIHVRRGDYVIHDTNFPPVSLSYIKMAMSLLPSNQKYIVFSDDIEWCKNNIVSDNVTFANGNEWEDLCVMASCGHNIIANSSFSWWGAWLNRNPDKIVFSPSCKAGQWFGPDAGVKNDCVDLLPPSWNQIEFRKWENIDGKWVDVNK